MSLRVVPVTYGLVVMASLTFGIVAWRRFQATTHSLDAVIRDHAETVIELSEFRSTSERAGRTARSYLLTKDDRFLEELSLSREELRAQANALQNRKLDPQTRTLLDRALMLETETEDTLRPLIAGTRSGAQRDLAEQLEHRVQPVRDQLSAVLDELSRIEEDSFRRAKASARETTQNALRSLTALSLIGIATAVLAGVALARTLVLLKKNRLELEASHQRLAAANRELDAFAGRVAHDLKNLLAPLRLAPSRLRIAAHASQDVNVERVAVQLERLSGRADGLLSGLLGFARAVTDGSEPLQGDLAAAAHAAVQDLESLAEEVAATVHVEVEPGAVACPTNLLHAVVLNLVGNALKFLRECSRREVWVRSHVADDHAYLSVEDSGPGIPATSLEKLFQPFYRVPGTKAEGSGIGLATVHRIVTAHQGRVRVDSQEGAGTTFTVILPTAIAVRP